MQWIDESLARGLTTLFFREMDELSTKAEKKFFTTKPKILDRNSFAKYVKDVKKSLSGAVLVDYEGGSKAQPYYIVDLIEIFKERKFNSWKERCLTGKTLIFAYSPRYFDYRNTFYSFGEHTIFRLFCRTKPIHQGTSIDSRYILAQMKQVPLWASFWAMQYYKKSGFGVNLNPILPAPNGMFLGKFDPESGVIEIRTFVGDSQLSETQYEVKTQLLKIGDPYICSPMSFYIPVVAKQIDFPQAININICYEIFHSHNFRSLKELLFEEIENDEKRASAKNLFEINLRQDIHLTNSYLIEEMKKNIRKSLIECKTGHYKYFVENPS